MKPELLTDEQVELEINRLWASDAVKLAKKEQQIKYRRRQQLYALRCMEKRGLALMDQGIDFDNIEDRLFGHEPESED